MSNSTLHNNLVPNHFYLLWLTLPLLAFPDFSVFQFSYGDISLYFLASTLALLSLFKSKVKLKDLPITFWPTSTVIFLVFQTLSFNDDILNLGKFLISWGSTLASIVFIYYFYNKKVNSVALSKIAVALSFIGSLNVVNYIIFGNFIFDFSSVNRSMGGPLAANRNLLTIFLVQLIPFLLVLESFKRKISFSWILLCRFSLFLNLYLAIALRTRTAWVIIGAYTLILIYLSIANKKVFKPLALKFGLTLAISIVAVNFIPSNLKWSGTSPYKSSLTSLYKYKKSSGRDKIWEIGIQMIDDASFFGLGSGQFSSFFYKFGSNSKTDTSKFKNRHIRYAFNEYLQAFVELGFIGGLAFLFWALICPIYILIKSSNLDRAGSTNTLFAMSALGASIASFFYYPFQTPLHLFTYILAMSVASSRLDKKSLFNKNILPTPKIHRYVYRVISGTVMLMTVYSTAGYLLFETQYYMSLKYRDVINPNVLFKIRKISQKVWPWYYHWNEKGFRYINDHIDHSSEKETLSFLHDRVTIWPYDRETLALAGWYNIKNKNYVQGMNYYKRVFTLSKNSACDKNLIWYYNDTYKQITESRPHLLLKKNVIGNCSSYLNEDKH